jgi:hypothetical protein
MKRQGHALRDYTNRYERTKREEKKQRQLNEKHALVIMIISLGVALFAAYQVWNTFNMG